MTTPSGSSAPPVSAEMTCDQLRAEFRAMCKVVVALGEQRDAARAELAQHAALVAAAKVLHGAAYELLASPLTQAQWEALPQPYRDAVLTLEYKVDAYTLAVQPAESEADPDAA